jgi:hypothetical protein
MAIPHDIIITGVTTGKVDSKAIMGRPDSVDGPFACVIGHIAPDPELATLSLERFFAANDVQCPEIRQSSVPYKNW